MFKKIFTNSFGILFSRILGFIRDLLTASILGANIYSDIFFVAFKFPNLFRRIFAEGAFTQSFLPSFISSKHKNLFAFSIFIRFFSIILIFSILVTIFSPIFTKMIAIGFDENLILQAAPYVAINFYYLDFIFCVTFLAALLQYKEHFATTAFSTALLNLSLIASLILFKNSEKSDIVLAMSIAVLIGGFLQFLSHLYMAKKLNILKRLVLACKGFKKKSQIVKNDLNRFYKNFFPAILGNSTAQISAFLDTWLASFLVSGSISYLYYANRVFQLPLALFAIATATALFPTVSKNIKRKDYEKALFHMKKSFWFLTFILSISTLGGIFLSKEIVWLLFERGSFTSQDTINTSAVLSMYLIGLLPYGLNKLFSLWLYANHKQLIAAKIATYSLITNILLSIILIFFLKAAGLALASSIAGFVLFIFTIKEFGVKKFLDIISTKIAFILLILLIIESIFLYFIKGFIDAYI
ncbi:murein biosynthesis integral membrane protein MurJ [Nitrosophilus kaiyonis]|uniref:murein biosynthesis integral membrane protein MurJ n=1 Tax=Nitrosophilus kaiyonis TaxID=2930200 RepID=UPI00249110A6|nr:murein biosynthesis integral membrane protein MurJ [Nitrosophilus kaiyonis]